MDHVHEEEERANIGKVPATVDVMCGLLSRQARYQRHGF